MQIITLLTDFGIKDGNVAVMKGIMWRIAPSIQIVDISHLVQPQNIQEAGLILFRSAPYFPPDTIHVIVVDPGVGTSRRAIAVKIDNHYFVCPDNGILTLLLDAAKSNNSKVECVHLDKPQWWLPQISSIFHGRDIFAPVAAHIACGRNMMEIGSPINDVVRFHLPKPEKTDYGWKAEVVYIDNFGNIGVNIHKKDIGETPDVSLVIRGITICGLVKTFGERPPGEIVILYSSTYSLIIAAVNGNAAEKINAAVGDSVDVFIK